MNMMTACCCQRTKRRQGRALCCQRYHVHKHKTSCAHMNTLRIPELRFKFTAVISTSIIHLIILHWGWWENFWGWVTSTPILRTTRVWQGIQRRYVDVRLCVSAIFWVESCQVGCHLILGEQDEQDHESSHNISTGTCWNTVMLPSSL